MEEGLLLDGVALHAGHVTPGNVQHATLVVTNFADPRLPLRNWAAMATGKTPNSVAIQFLVEFALANPLKYDFSQCRHRAPVANQSPSILALIGVGRDRRSRVETARISGWWAGK
jgi:hypothetical protein